MFPNRTMRRIKQRYEEFGYDGLFDQRRGKRSLQRIPMETAERVLAPSAAAPAGDAATC